MAQNKPGAKPITKPNPKVNASSASQKPNPSTTGVQPSAPAVPPEKPVVDPATVVAPPVITDEEKARLEAEEKVRLEAEAQAAEEERKAQEEEAAAQAEREAQAKPKKSLLPEFLSVRMRHMNPSIKASKYYIYSTLTCPQEYALWRNGGSDIQIKEKSVLINGGANVAGKYIITPKGVLTIVTDEQMEILKSNKSFIRHCERGFIKVEAGAVDIDKVVSDMMSRDESAPLIKDDYNADDAANKTPILNKTN